MSELTVAEVMQRDVVFMKPGDRLDLVDDVMNLGRIRHVPVVEGDRLHARGEGRPHEEDTHRQCDRTR